MATAPVAHAVLATLAARLGRQARAAVVAWQLGLAALLAAAAPVAQAGVSGLWTTGGGDYVVFLQDGSSGATFALQVPGSLDALKVWLGSGSASSITLQGLTAPSDLRHSDHH